MSTSCRAGGRRARQRIIDEHLAGKTGMMACERMVDILDKISTAATAPKRSIAKQIQRRVVTHLLHLAKAIKYHLPGSHNRPEFQKHRFPGIAPDQLARRIQRFQKLLGEKQKLRVDPISDVLVRIQP